MGIFMKKFKLALLLLIVSLFTVACSNGATDEKTTPDQSEEQSESVELTVSAAISLTDALNEIKESYEEENNVTLTFNYGGSGTLAQQIQQGAPVDVFISANQDWMDTLEEEALIIDDTRDNITGNSIVLITQEDSDHVYESIEELKADDVEQIAIGNPESVPAGNYTEQTLKHIDLWEELEDKFVLAKDVRQVLTYVESGNADIGFVYESDALTSDQIEILATAEEKWHDPIIYPGAIIADTEHEDEATAFLNYMLTDEAQEILEKYGFKQ